MPAAAPLRTFSISPLGAFSLAEAVRFGFGQRDPGSENGEDGEYPVMRLGFCLDGYRRQVAVELRQDGAGPENDARNGASSGEDGAPVGGTVHGTVHADEDVDIDAVRRQVARVLSLDHDARPLQEIGRRDPVIGRLLAVAPGLRPPLFYSPYEAAAWSVLSARRPAAQMAEVRRRLSEQHGRTYDVSGQELAVLPLPEQLLEVQEFPGLPAEKLARLHGVAQAALDGALDADRLLKMGPEAATAWCQRIKGIGPFYAALIVVRGTGFADVVPTAEPTLLGLVTRLYRLPEPCDAATITAIAEQWRPLRTWCAVLVRAASSRLPEAG